MTTDTTYREQGRAVFLAAIVVISMVAASAAFAGAATATHDPDPRSADVSNLSTVWEGETVEITNFSSDETVEFEHEDDFTQEVADGNGTVTLDSTDLSSGTWTVSANSLGESQEFTVRSQSLSEFSYDSDATTLSLDSNRAEYTVALSSDSLSASDLNDVLDTGNLVHEGEDGESYVVTVDSNDVDLGVDPSAIDPGTYSIDAEVIDTGASATTNVTVQEDDETQVNFESSVNEEAGDVADVGLEVTNANQAYVTMDTSTVDGEAWVQLDQFGEDNVTLQVNTYNLSQGTGTNPFSAENANVADWGYNNTDGNSVDMQTLEQRWPGGYSFTLQSYTADPINSDERADDRTRLSLESRSTDSVTTWVAPGNIDLNNVEEPSDLTEDATQRNTVASGDVVFAQVEASGIYGYSAQDNGSFDQQDVHFYLNQETEGPLGGTEEVRVNVSNIDGATVVPDSDNNQFFVAFSPDAVDEVETGGDSWDLTFEVGTDNPYVSGDEAQMASSSFSFEELSLEFAGDMTEEGNLQVAAQSGSQIVAETNAAPGTDGEIFVVLQDATETADDISVSEDGELVGEFDFSGRENGEILEQIEAVVFGQGGDVEQTTTGVFGEGNAPSFAASGDAPSPVTVGEDATLDATVTNEGGASGEASISVTIDGEEVAANTTEIASGDSWSQSFSSIPTDSEGEIDWSIDAGDSTDSGTVTVEPEEMDGDGDGDGMDGDDGNDTDTDDGDGDEQPGFGLVVALFALIGAALLALRRQN